MKEFVCAQCAKPCGGPGVEWVTSGDLPTCSWKCAMRVVDRYTLKGWDVVRYESSLRGIPYFKAIPPRTAVPTDYLHAIMARRAHLLAGIHIAPATGPC